MKKLIFLLIMLTACVKGFSQRKIQGKVIASRDSTPCVNVQVMIKGTTIGTLTKNDGTFELTITDSLEKIYSPLILVVNYVGFTSTEIQIGNMSSESLSVILKEAGNLTDSVVVIGYGTEGNRKEMVSFPWPPPDFSTRALLDRNYFNGANKLQDVDLVLTNALNRLGYTEKAYFYIPNGFVIVTRIEQITENGESLSPPERWSVKTKSMKRMNWASYIRSLFFSTPGYFRIIVFTVTDKAFNSSGKKIKKETAIRWLNAGLNVLPEEIKKKKFGADYNCTALIYEFKKPESSDAYLLNPSLITAGDHLEKSKIINALNRR